jgi:hypothetical protein
MICKDNGNSKIGSFMSSCLLVCLIHYSAYMIRNEVRIVSDLNHCEKLNVCWEKEERQLF